MTRIAINGLGRIGRLVLRQLVAMKGQGCEVVAVNDLVDIENLAYLLKYDSVHGRAAFEIQRGPQSTLLLDGLSVPVYAEPDPLKLPWAELGVDVVIEATGRFKKRAEAAKHLQAGAHRVLIGAPAADADLTLVMGVNQQAYAPAQHQVLSNASCTTNSLAPVMKVLLDNFGVEKAHVTTVHAYTISQNMVDGAKSDMARGRAGALNIIPTSTGADKATVAVLPQLVGRLAACALRVPVADGALTDISVELSREVSEADINEAMRMAAEGAMQGILEYSEEALVSCDIIGNPHSAIVHGLSTRVIQGNFARLQVWYDNEYAYAQRCVDVVTQLPM